MKPMHMALVALGALLALQCVAAELGPSSTGKPVEQSSMAITFYNSEYAPMYFSMSQCELLVRRAAKHGSKRIQFVPTHYWYEKENLKWQPGVCHADNWSVQNKVDWYCYKHEWNSDCTPWNDGALNTFRTGFTNCLKVAAELFDDIMVAPHLDEGLKVGKWRNFLHNDPFWKDPHGYSFWDIMQKPILDAANDALAGTSGKTFWFGVEGEMGGTVLSNPAQYKKMYGMIKQGWNNPATIKVGSTFNHAYIMGYITRGPGSPPVLPPTPMAPYDGGWGPLLPFEQWPNYEEAKKNLPAIKALLEASDFLGVSNYARAGDGNNVTPKHIESGAAKMVAEFEAMGVKNIRDIIKRKVFMYNEFGLGGGLSECGDTPGSDSKVGFFPWLGVTTSYEASKDPFKRPAVKEFAIKYYQALMKVLDAGGWEFPLHHSYIWNCVSWDVQGIHTASALWNTDVDQGDWPVKNGFAIQEVIDIIKDHNKKAQAAEAARKKRREDRAGSQPVGVAAARVAATPAKPGRKSAKQESAARKAMVQRKARAQHKAQGKVQNRANQRDRKSVV